MTIARKLTGDHCQCTACGEYFNSTAAFDMHRIGKPTDRKCRTVDDMLARGMVKNDKDWWVTEKHSDSSILRTCNSGDRIDPATPVQGMTIAAPRTAPEA